MQIAKLDWQDTLAIRHEVLWPNEPQEFCHVEGDENAMHYGVIVDQKLVSVASVYFEVDESNHNNKSARLRKFATLIAYQKQGIGSFLINHIIDSLKAHNISYFWCDARESAIEFYTRFGFACEGPRFYKSDIPYYKMHIQNT